MFAPKFCVISIAFLITADDWEWTSCVTMNRIWTCKCPAICGKQNELKILRIFLSLHRLDHVLFMCCFCDQRGLFLATQHKHLLQVLSSWTYASGNGKQSFLRHYISPSPWKSDEAFLLLKDQRPWLVHRINPPQGEGIFQQGIPCKISKWLMSLQFFCPSIWVKNMLCSQGLRDDELLSVL